MSKGVEFGVIWLAVIFLACLATFHTKLSKTCQNVVAFLSVVVFSWMYSYRTLGLDLRNYMDFWNNVSVFSLAEMLQPTKLYNSLFEPVFTGWIYISKIVGLSFNQSLFVYVFVPLLVFYMLINRYTKYPLVGLSVFMILFMFYFDLTRMVFALAFALCAYMTKNKLLKVSLYAFAFSSQFTSIILFIYEIIAGSKWLEKMSFPKMILGSALFVQVLNMSMSFLENSNNKFFFKMFLYINIRDNFVNTSQMIVLTLACVYPLFMGLFFYNKYKGSLYLVNSWDAKVLSTLKIGVAAAIVAFPFGVRTVQRIMLPAITPLVLYLTPIVAEKIYINDGKINLKEFDIVIVLFLYDVLMSAYYLWVAATY